MYPQAAPAPYSGCKGVGIALLLGSPGWLATGSPLPAAAAAALGAALLSYGWARAPFAPLTIAHMWPDPHTPGSTPPTGGTGSSAGDSTPLTDGSAPRSSTGDSGPHLSTGAADGRFPAGGGDSRPPSESHTADDTDEVQYVRRTGSTAYGRRSTFPSFLALLHAEFSTPLRVRQWRRNRPEQT
ncbi:hypothetical protein CLV63_1158 [Murinocardiopsis flavida]|uniref:Uncharacterized protein n=1 Tax=Murinocardiopsis flavida TaxID=645275 RepID=A0A2P8DDS6_9ACTN|nr:hypothetical protein [Murinocardiopsis flavida]PSK95349.1 hypothetical protein CLV63_1158 [Murinocardiopsis flavida]